MNENKPSTEANPQNTENKYKKTRSNSSPLFSYLHAWEELHSPEQSKRLQTKDSNVQIGDEPPMRETLNILRFSRKIPFGSKIKPQTKRNRDRKSKTIEWTIPSTIKKKALSENELPGVERNVQDEMSIGRSVSFRSSPSQGCIVFCSPFAPCWSHQPHHHQAYDS